MTPDDAQIKEVTQIANADLRKKYPDMRLREWQVEASLRADRKKKLHDHVYRIIEKMLKKEEK